MSSREQRLTDTLTLIQGDGGEWGAGRLHRYRRAHGGAVQRGTARRDLATLHQRGYLTQHRPDDGRYYTSTRKGAL
ncbi:MULTISPECIES: hypothetical protein [unclassified Streptomyces]|uniref:hypothetical protein n=1 Tax=unclassified Streptomyces TaxID=2593676 RepID=UPI0013A70275|nr:MULTISPECIES: hypothetical protein [unclassified Streptomyces]QZZ26576.1 hypothetical protein A7X85_10180 [Streptomyces sp. ST1015]